MDYIIEYNNEQYFIILTPFDKSKAIGEVFRLRYSELENDWVEYWIQVFICEADKLHPRKINELSDPLKEIIAKEIKKDLERTFMANPYFDELMFFVGNEVFTYQEQLIPIHCNICEKKNLYEKRNKGNKSDYINNIVKLMEEDKNPDWPFKEDLLVQFSVSNSLSKLNRVDLDNLAKTILDIFKGVVYESDSQIISFAGDKSSVNSMKAFIVAIKKLAPKEKPSFQDYLFSGKMNAWQDEYKEKQRLLKPTRFKVYGSFQKNSP